MRTAAILLTLLLISCSSEKSSNGGHNPEPNSTIVPVENDQVNSCLSGKTNLSSDLLAVETQLNNLKNAKEIADGLFRASCIATP